MSSLHGGSLEITLTIPLIEKPLPWESSWSVVHDTGVIITLVKQISSVSSQISLILKKILKLKSNLIEMMGLS